MKKILALTLTFLMLFSTFGVTACAETEPSVTVYVTISDKGDLVIAQEEVTVTDTDGDGTLTVNDALYAAHEANYEGGAAAGYSSYEGEYGLSLGKLWGDTSGSFGYYVNHVSAMSLSDAVKEGDFVTAFVFADAADWSDAYSYFDVNTVDGETGKEVTLTLSMAGYDADWNPITLPVAGAVITLNGEPSEYKTDDNGNVTISFDKEGSYVISAASDAQILVPPVCKAMISDGAASIPSDGVFTSVVWWIVLGVVSLFVIAAIIVLIVRKKKSHEK